MLARDSNCHNEGWRCEGCEPLVSQALGSQSSTLGCRMLRPGVYEFLSATI